MQNNKLTKSEERLYSAAQPFVASNEKLQVVIPAQNRGMALLVVAAGAVGVGVMLGILFGLIGMVTFGALGALVALLAMRFRYYILVATNKRILVLDCGPWKQHEPKSVLVELPRKTDLAVAKSMYTVIPTDAGPVYIHKGYKRELAAANQAVSGN